MGGGGREFWKTSAANLDTAKSKIYISIRIFTSACERSEIDNPLKRQSRLQQTTFINIFSFFFSEKIRLDFQVSPLLGRGFK